jgi:hypothetical protein
VRTYLTNLVAGFSHFINALTGGDPDHSFSARIGAAVHRGKAWAAPIAGVIDLVLFSRNHCLEHAREEGLI